MAFQTRTLSNRTVPGFTAPFPVAPTADIVAASEPPDGSSIVPGIPNSLLGDIASGVLAFFGGGGGGQLQPPTTFGPPLPSADPLGLAGDCPGLFSVKLPDGRCLNLGDIAPGGDPAVTGQAPTNGIAPTAGFGQPVNGRHGVGIMPRVEAMAVRRCPKGMALGNDGVCYDGLGRNSPKREWPMGMKPLLTPGERNAIRIAGRAAGKLARSKKTLRKTARELEKAC